MKRIVCVIGIFLLLSVILTACSKDVSVTIHDAGQNTVVRTQSGVAVSKLLEQNKITVNDKDEVDPPTDSTITDKTGEIIIKRCAKVTVQKGLDAKEIELVGATVQDAVDQSGFKIEKGEELDCDPTEYLSDGMLIRITHEVSVTLQADGETKKVKTKAATVKDFLEEQEITLGEDDEVSQDLDALTEKGMIITVKRITYKEEILTESIAYKTVEKSGYSMYNSESGSAQPRSNGESGNAQARLNGESKIIQEGSNGEKEVLYKVKYVDGVEVSREKLDEEQTKEAVDEIIVKGTNAVKLTNTEAEAIVKKFWGDAASDESADVIVSDGLKTSGGKEYYAFRLMKRVDDGNGESNYSTMDFQYVNAYTGEVVSKI